MALRSIVHAAVLSCAVALPALAPLKAEADDKASQPDGKVMDDSAIYDVPLGNGARTGPDDALVTMVVFADFACPFSARVVDTLSMLKALYKDDLRVVFRHNQLVAGGAKRAQHPKGADARRGRHGQAA